MLFTQRITSDVTRSVVPMELMCCVHTTDVIRCYKIGRFDGTLIYCAYPMDVIGCYKIVRFDGTLMCCAHPMDVICCCKICRSKELICDLLWSLSIVKGRAFRWNFYLKSLFIFKFKRIISEIRR